MHNFGGGRSDLFNSGDVVKRGRDIFKIQRGVKKFRGIWTLDEAMVSYRYLNVSFSW